MKLLSPLLFALLTTPAKGIFFDFFASLFGGTAKTEYTITVPLNIAQTEPLCTASAGTAMGNAVMTYSTETKELCMYLSYIGLSGTELFSHIHGPATFGATGEIVKTLSTGTNKRDCFTFNDEEETSLLAGLFYVNVHSPTCNSGEIRGQIVPSA